MYDEKVLELPQDSSTGITHIPQPISWCRAMTELNITAGGEDFQCLLGPPATQDVVKWSEDNLLAVSTERGVIILSPCNLSGARHFAAAAEDSEGAAQRPSSFVSCSPYGHAR